MDMSNADVYVRKEDGSRSGPFRGTLSAKSLIVKDKKFDVEEGDLIVRSLPSGREEAYLVRTAQFYEGFGGIAQHWQLVIEKTTALPPIASHAPTVNIHNSTGIQVGNGNLMNFQTAINEMIKRIDDSDSSASEKAEAKSRLQAFLSHPLVGSIVGGIVGASF
ncbi:RIP homotypic interaction motif-containing protein [Achromobacter mucicolens]|uniref:RIP homotypic interaction motif-containing protein n=1 Tax=Achromobacter mucicolens TaxID=1389922 RepID=UPI00289F3C14|nr:RIP homotypic interaction motif-containing protein [Achromobacter mucicolens]